MKVTLREKELKGGRKRLYLDYYPPIPHPETGKPTRREFLDLFLYVRPRTEPEKLHNRETKATAERLKTSRQLDVQNGQYGFLKSKGKDVDFVEYLREQVHGYTGRSRGSQLSWLAMSRNFAEFAGGPVSSRNLTPEYCNRFKEFLISKGLKYNTAANYFQHFKTCLKRAVEDGTLPTDFTAKVKRLPYRDGQREFLTLAELTTLFKTDCRRPDIKNAALFSALTGLRYSDIAALTWQQVQESDNGPCIRLTIQKTQSAETIPITEQARDLLGEPGEPTAQIFTKMGHSYTTRIVREWLKEAGIERHISFHCFRHTFATLQLEMGTDIYTISKLLGHKNLSTTQIYAKVKDKLKRDAVNRLKITL